MTFIVAISLVIRAAIGLISVCLNQAQFTPLQPKMSQDVAGRLGKLCIAVIVLHVRSSR